MACLCPAVGDVVQSGEALALLWGGVTLSPDVPVCADRQVTVPCAWGQTDGCGGGT